MKNVYYVYFDYTQEEIPRLFYVGKGLKRRVSNLKRNKHHSSISKKYGIKREIVFFSFDNQLVCELEIELIKQFHTFVEDVEYKFGANYTIGGEGVVGRHHTEEFKNQLRSRCKENSPNYGITRSKESKLKNRLSHLDTHHTEETCEKISESRQGMKFTDVHKKNMSIPVYQYDLLGNYVASYDSCVLASSITNTCYNSIIQCCLERKNYSKAGNFVWRYFKCDKIEIAKFSKKSIQIFQYDEQFNLIQFFSSLNVASKTLKIHRRIIQKCCENNESYNGFNFAYNLIDIKENKG